MTMTKHELARHIDHSLLKPFLSDEDIINGCNYAMDVDCVTVCVNSNRVKLAYDLVKDSNTVVCSVVGFPLGAHTAASKAFETEEAYKNGAKEIDTVIDIGALKSKRYDDVRDDIAMTVKASPAIVKVILENCYLTKEEIATVSKICAEAGAHYVKTSTGFGSGGATLEDIKIMKDNIPDTMKIKAAGGISTLKDSLAFIDAGCERIGVSKTKEILAEMDK